MKKLMMGLILTAAATTTWAGTKTRILNITEPETMADSYEVLVAKNTTPLTVAQNNLELLEKLKQAEEFNSVIEIETLENEITSLEVIESGDDVIDFYNTDEELHPMTNYTPSNVNSYEDAERMFKYLKRRTKWFTECFNRAHIWSKQMFDRDNVDSMKIFIFYTKKYRRTVKGKWWFHVAPMIDVNGQYYVMDKEFTRKPVLEHNWENIFTRKLETKGIKGYRCKVIRNIKEYYDKENQNSEYCNILITSMHYWMPLDMSNLDRKGQQQTEWSNRDLRSAAREVFWGWKKVYREVKVK